MSHANLEVQNFKRNTIVKPQILHSYDILRDYSPLSKHLTPAMDLVEAVEMEIEHCESSISGKSSSNSLVSPHLIFATTLELVTIWKPKAETAFRGIPTESDMYRIRKLELLDNHKLFLNLY